MRSLLLGSLLLSLAGSIWGAMFIAVRLSIQVIAPVPLVWMRYGVALLSLLVLVTFLHESLSIARKDWKRVFFVALIGQTTSIVTQETGTMLTSAQAGSVLTASTPVFMVIFGVWLLHERLTAGRVASVVLATVGMLLITFDPDSFTVTPLGALLLVIASITWALMSVLLKRLSKYSTIAITFHAVWIAFLLLTPYSLYWLFVHGDPAAMAAPTVWGSVLYLGVVSTTAGFALWNKGLLYMDASLGGLFMFFQPIVGSFLGWLVLGEEMTTAFWAGSALIGLGVACALRGGNTTAEEKLERTRGKERKSS